MERKLVLLAGLLHLGASYPVSGFPLNYEVGNTYQFQYTTETVLHHPTSSQHPDKTNVGFKLLANIELAPIWSSGQELLVKLTIQKPKLQSVARPDMARDLQGLPKLPVLFQWEAGRVRRVFASEDDSTVSVNLKKGIISLLQLQVEEGNHKEIDASGECQVSYKKSGGTLTRIKENCQNIETAGQYSTINPMMSITYTPVRKTTYTMSEDLITSIEAAEDHLITLNLENSIKYSVKMTQQMKATKSGRKGKSYKGGDLDEVIKKVSKDLKVELYGMVLETLFEPRPCPAASDSLTDLIREHTDNLKPNKMATTDAAQSFFEVCNSMRSVSKDNILAVLKDKDNDEIIGSLIDAAAMAQTSATQSALMEFLAFDDYYHIEHPERYLLATAFSTHPTAGLLEDLLKLYNRDLPSEMLHESVGESLGAVVHTYCSKGEQCQEQIVRDILSTFLDKLEKCEKTDCKPMVLRALANTALPENLPVLLKYAETSKNMKICEAAIKAILRLNKQTITEEVKSVMRRIFYQSQRGYDTPVRSQALTIILDNEPTQEDISNIIQQSTDPHNTEYSMYIQARLFNLVERNDLVKEKVKNTLNDTSLSNWHILAPKGKSLAFNNLMAETSSTTSTYFMYVENSRAGILKRSGMDVFLFSPLQTLPMYSFQMFAAGLEGLLGEEVEPGEEDASPTAGMSLDLIGVSLRPITFFTGQSGLMSAVWNAPSEPTSALQITFLITDHLERLHLQNGLITEVDLQAAMSMDMSGSISISLWNKNSKSLVKNSGAISIRGSTSIVTSQFRAGIEITNDMASVMDFQTDVDFYDGIKMCLQMSRPGFVTTQNIAKYEHAVGFKKGYISRKHLSRKINGISYPLPRPNAKQCRALLGGS